MSKKIRVDIVGDNRKLKESVKDSERSVNKFGKSVQNVGKLIAGAFAVRAVVKFAGESLKLYNIQAQAEQQLLVALKGREDVQQRLIKQAQDLQKTTLFGDEETIRAQALIAAFVKEEDQIRTIIPLVQDLASAKGMDLAGAADLVSKTLGSSTNALARYGIEVTGTVGSTERLQSLSKGLSNAFEGQAAAAAKAGTGGLQQLQNRLGDLRESFGGIVNAILEDLLPAFEKIVTGAEKAMGLLDKLEEKSFGWVTGINKNLKEYTEEADKYIKTFEKTISGLSDEEKIKATADEIENLNTLIKSLRNQYSLLDKEPTGRKAKKELKESTQYIYDQVKAIQLTIDLLQKYETATDNAAESLSESNIVLTDEEKAAIKTYEALKKLNAERYKGLKAVQDQKRTSDEQQNQKFIQDVNDVTDAQIQAWLTEETILDEKVNKIDSTSYVLNNAFSDIGASISNMALEAGNSWASMAGEIVNGNMTIGDSLKILTSQIFDALGAILIMAGLKSIEGGEIVSGLGLIGLGLASKGIGSIISASGNRTESYQPLRTSPSGGPQNASMLYGNDIRTSNQYYTGLYNRVG